MVLRHISVPDGHCSVVGLTFENLLRLANGWPLRLTLPQGSLLLCALATDQELEEMFPEPETTLPLTGEKQC